MDIESIIYNTTRDINNLDDKLSIATIFLFCEKLSSKSFAELLYSDDHMEFINELNKEYSKFEVDFTIRFDDKNVKECFYKTLVKVIDKYDSNGYYKALFDGDEFAIVIDEIVNYNFDDIKIKQFTQNVAKQLSINFLI